MKKIYIIYIMLAVGLLSCVEDEGSYTLSPVNEITVSGIEEEYNKVSYSETLNINPEIKMSSNLIDENQLAYLWFICNGSISDEQHTIIGTEKKLDYPLNIPPGTYNLYFQILDKTTGLKWENVTKLKTISQFVRGFYLFGDKEDGTCGIDFISIMEKRDTTLIEDIFVNSLGIKGAQNLVFTGPYNAKSTSLWAITESGSYSIENSASLSSFDIREDVSAENMIFPTIELTRPLKTMDIYPHPIGSSNICLSRSNRILTTENEVFIASIVNGPEAYGNPVNRYSGQTSELYKPAPYIFYPGNSTYISRIVLYDETHQRFTGLNNSYSFATYSKDFTKDDASPFYFDQTKYSPVRTLVYGENGYGNAGRSYALMKDADNKYYIYAFTTSTATPNKQYGGEVDQAKAVNFNQASHHAFFSMQMIILYSVGSQLWAYDYNRKEAKMLEDFGSEITFLAMDYHSNNTPTDFIVATYSTTEKGVVRKYTLVDDQNKIEATPHEKEVWKTNLKVVKVEYRNSSL